MSFSFGVDLEIKSIYEQLGKHDSFLKSWQDQGTTGWKWADVSSIYKDNRSPRDAFHWEQFQTT